MLFFCRVQVVRSSTDKLQDVYAKAKTRSVLIRFPCNLAETVADKSLKIATTVATPIMKPFQGPGKEDFASLLRFDQMFSRLVRVIDDFTAGKLRQIEAKYPVIKSTPEQVLNTLNEKSEPVRNAMTSVKETTTSTIQHGKQTVIDCLYRFVSLPLT